MKWITHIKARCLQPKLGFTLIETLVAVTIVSLAVSGPLFSANRTIIAAQISSDKLTASYLAQEGLEYVHAIRDNNYLSYYNTGGSSTAAWNNFRAITAKCKTTVCTLDPWQSPAAVTINALTPCTGTCKPLSLSSSGYNTQSPGPNNKSTQFTRTISMKELNQNEVRVVSEVQWKFHNITYSVKATDHLTAWQ